MEEFKLLEAMVVVEKGEDRDFKMLEFNYEYKSFGWIDAILPNDARKRSLLSQNICFSI